MPNVGFCVPFISEEHLESGNDAVPFRCRLPLGHTELIGALRGWHAWSHDYFTAAPTEYTASVRHTWRSFLPARTDDRQIGLPPPDRVQMHGPRYSVNTIWRGVVVTAEGGCGGHATTYYDYYCYRA